MNQKKDRSKNEAVETTLIKNRDINSRFFIALNFIDPT